MIFNFQKPSRILRVMALALLFSSATPSFGFDPIVRPYQSIRSSGMGGLKITTGLYDENFFGNPARVCDNPKWRLQLPDPMVEFNSTTQAAFSSLAGGSFDESKLSPFVGQNVHARVQLSFPTLYLPRIIDQKTSIAVGLLTSIQTDINPRRSYSIQPSAIADLSPVLNVGRKFLNDESLGIGVNLSYGYRMSVNPSFSIIDFVKGASFKPASSAGQGAGFDAGIGATYELPWQILGGDIVTGFSVNNIMGGLYPSKVKLVSFGSQSIVPAKQPTSFNFGTAYYKKKILFFTDNVFAIEMSDIGNNGSGSLFRLLHMGGEMDWKLFAFRFGLNQGYWAGGLGINLKFVDLSFATYGEELGLNAGQFEDRRYALRLALQI